jgi:AcrR family transcriptional regulator
MAVEAMALGDARKVLSVDSFVRTKYYLTQGDPMTDSPTQETNPTKVSLLEAAKKVLLAEGYSGLSTRAIAAAADTQMSQIRYHFGSKEGIVLALYEYMTGQLLERQAKLLADESVPIWQRWQAACDYLDADLQSGYVGVFQELIAAGWSNPKVAASVRASLDRWRDLHVEMANEFCAKSGSLGPFDAEDIAALVGPVFVGIEAYLLLDVDEKSLPLRRALRRLGDVIRHFETRTDVRAP